MNHFLEVLRAETIDGNRWICWCRPNRQFNL